jgi:hypothetical protein
MPISVCEYCGKPFNTFGAPLCADCSKLIEESYIKSRKYIYQNSKSDFGAIVEATGVTEKALSYLINKGRILVANRQGSGVRCRACGKETSSGQLCDACAARILSEKLSQRSEEEKKAQADPGKKSIVPISFSDNRNK